MSFEELTLLSDRNPEIFSDGSGEALLIESGLEFSFLLGHGSLEALFDGESVEGVERLRAWAGLMVEDRSGLGWRLFDGLFECLECDAGGGGVEFADAGERFGSTASEVLPGPDEEGGWVGGPSSDGGLFEEVGAGLAGVLLLGGEAESLLAAVDPDACSGDGCPEVGLGAVGDGFGEGLERGGRLVGPGDLLSHSGRRSRLLVLASGASLLDFSGKRSDRRGGSRAYLSLRLGG